MGANTFGRFFCVTTFGESHGPAVGCVVDGCPPRLPLSEEDLFRELKRRRPGASRFVTQRQEEDAPEILSGVFEGQTLGTPIAILVRNRNIKSEDYENLKEVFRPGHADYTTWQKYGIRDWRGGGRASARETVGRVAAGAIAKKWLSLSYGVQVQGWLAEMGGVEIPFESLDAIEQNPFFSPNLEIIPRLEEALTKARVEKDSLGAVVEVVAYGVPPGWGDPVFAKLDAQISCAMMGIPAVKGVEVGDGFSSARARGSTHGDEMAPSGFLSNHAGGILGGISTGQPLLVRLAFKPTSSIPIPRRTVNLAGEAAEVCVLGRHDPCVGIRGVVVAESMLALVLMDAALAQRAQNQGAEEVRPRIPGMPSPR